MKKEELQEFKSHDQFSHTPDPIDTGKTKRDKDNTKHKQTADEIEDDVKTPQGTAGKKSPSRRADKKMSEELDTIFGEDLSEEALSKIKTIFETAVDVAVAEALEEKRAELEESYEEKLKEEIEAAVDDLNEKADQYLNHIIKEWLVENEIAIESGIKVHMAESLIDGLSGLLSEHNIQVDESSLDVLGKLEEDLTKANGTIDSLLEENTKLKEETVKFGKKMVIDELSEGLTASQVSKLEMLSENVSFADMDEFTNKMKVIKEKFVTNTPDGKVVSESQSSVLTEEVNEPKTPSVTNSLVEAAARALNKNR